MADRAERDPREAVWIARVIAHDDHDAFGELVALHQSAVRRFLLRLTSNDASRADDLAQETFFKAYKHIRTFESRGRFLSWLFRIAWQLFVTEERGPRVIETELPDEMQGDDDAIQRIADARTFDQLMTLLNTNERAATVLHYRHELTHPEIADVLALPLGTVKSILRRAHTKLREAHGIR